MDGGRRRRWKERHAVTGEIHRYRRFKGWDYANGASLFITVATEPRRPLFGVARNGGVSLSPLGAKVKEALEAIPLLNPGIRLFGHVVMPELLEVSVGQRERHLPFRHNGTCGDGANIAALLRSRRSSGICQFDGTTQRCDPLRRYYQ